MTMRVDHVSFCITGYQEFSGPVIIRQDFVPKDDDPLVAALLERNREMLLAAVQAEGEAKGIL